MHSKRISEYVLPVVSLLLILEILNTAYGIKVPPLDYFQQVRFRTDAAKEIQKAKTLSAEGDFETAEQHLYRSLRSSPLIPLSYIQLSRIYIETGEYGKANTGLERAYALSPRSYGNLWQISLLAFRSGNEGLAREVLVHTSGIYPDRSFRLAWKVIDDGDYIMKTMVDRSNITNYLYFLMSEQKVRESLLVWERIREEGVEPDDRLFFGYVDFLVRNQRAQKAFGIWTDRMGEAQEGLVWNGGFEREITGSGFDWTVRRGDGFTVTYDRRYKTEGDYSLVVIFNGGENVDFRHVSKIVPVRPGADYIFSSDIKTEGITTDRGVFWSMDCFPSGGMPVIVPSYEGYTGTSDWFESSVRFRTPVDECSAVRLYLRRMRSNKLDKYIEGKVWVDSVGVEEITVN